MVVCSDKIKEYLDRLEKHTLEEYEVAEKARKQGFDPEDKVDIPLASDVADRCEGIVGAVAPEILNVGVAERIRELEKEYGSGDWRIAFFMAADIARNKFYEFKSLQKGLEVGVRIGLAYITLGVTCAPLEGFIELKLKKRLDGGDYCAVYYAGPVRSAGGTAAAVSVLIADYARKELGIKDYDPQPVELDRYFAEMVDYHEKVSRLQYNPTEEEIKFLVSHVPVELNGDPTSTIEVSNFKRLDRVETDLIRGGMCLVLGEGLSLKAKKIIVQIAKWGESVGMGHWKFLEEFTEMQKRIHSQGAGVKNEAENASKVKPNTKFIDELVAGRPVFSHPMREGGFRLRYGRTRLSGLAAANMHPASMRITDDFVATGVQLKVERPGKACAISPCDSIKGPFVKLKNGSVKWLNTESEALEFRSQVKEVLFIGDILFCYGDFKENGSMLVPPGYVQEWWVQELKKALIDKDLSNLQSKISVSLDELFRNPVVAKVSLDDAIIISRETSVPLHPDYIFFWKNISADKLRELVSVFSGLDFSKSDVLIPGGVKRVLEDLYVPHEVRGDGLFVEKEVLRVLLVNLGFNNGFKELIGEDSLEIVNNLCSFKIRDFGGVFIGSRMGRPEKAKMRHMTGSPQGLFPVGEEGGRLRSFNAAMEKGSVLAEFPLFHCDKCGSDTVYRRCEKCGERASQKFYCYSCKRVSDKLECCGHKTKKYSKRSVDVNYYARDAVSKSGLQLPNLVKGVRGVWDKDRLTENFMKALLRSKNNVYVNKDGTVRYDIIETISTHFTPEEIGLSVVKAQELGYSHDVNGKPLVDESQVVEILPQDIIMPDCKEWDGASCADFLIKVCNFVDDELKYLYGLSPYFNVSKKDDLFGLYVISLAPHTSAGIVSRVIGFSKTQGFYAHPYLHAACRRNADGDELGVILLMDALLNFSRQFLPDRRGGRTMDAPLVLSVKLDPLEIDSEAYNVDIVSEYPLEFYEAACECKMPWEVKIKRVENVLNTPGQYEGLKYTHPTSSMNNGPLVSAYKTLESMSDKMDAQLGLAIKFRCVDADDVARLIIEKHFLKDLKGNLRKYSSQGFRCVNCNEKYRRPPLSGKCNHCGGKIILTIAEGSVKKYLEPCMKLKENFNLPAYLQQDLLILERRIDGLFGKPLTKQVSLMDV
ncbi:DNA polymerase II large subunit [archaeon CG06_land_8_20_14_3_00_37_11]|nr:MAG: DNA polymerase II large subunit [archaeon CG06_land_8_20_14_3_00_37_11]